MTTAPVVFPGERYGWVYVLAELPERNKTGGRRFLIVCACRRLKIVEGHNLRTGATRSCGCRYAGKSCRAAPEQRRVENGIEVKRCARCGEVKPRSGFQLGKTWPTECRSCIGATKRRLRKASAEKYRATKRAYRQTPIAQRQQREQRVRQSAKAKRAVQIVRAAVKAGKLIRPLACPRCGQDDVTVHAHHEDYNCPLDVIWLCPRCHSEEHGRAKHPLPMTEAA
jgi:hypothetical protein